MRPLRSLLLCVVSAGLLLPAATAGTVTSAKDWKKLKSAVARDLRGKDAERRLRAIDKLGYADWPDAVRMLLKMVRAPDPRADALEKRFAQLTKFIQQINKSVRDRGNLITPDERQNRQQYFNELKQIRRSLNAISFSKRRIVKALGLTRTPEAVLLINQAAEKEKDAVTRAFLITALGHVPDTDAADIVRAAVAQEESPWVRTSALDALGVRVRESGRVAEDLQLVLGALSADEWPVRAAAVDVLKTLGKLAVPQAIEPLIARLAEEEGRLKGDIAEALSAMTGAAVGPDHELWKSWWAANKQRVLADQKAGELAVGADGAAAKKGHATTAKFYGITTTSKRIAFVIDLSGSMTEPANVPDDPAARRRSGGAATTGGHGGEGPPPADDPSQKPLPPNPDKLDVVKRELMKAIWGLPKDAVFGLIGYHEDAQLMGRGIMKASRKNKVDVGKMVDAWTAQGGTNTYDALLLALSLGQDKKRPDKKFKDGIDTIFLLSDGLPSFGKVVDPDEIVQDISERVRRRRVKIHTIWIDTGDGGRNPAIKQQAELGGRFMKELAEATGGKFVKR